MPPKNGAIVICQVCGEPFYVPKGRFTTAKFCSNMCRGVDMSQSRLGVSLSQEHRNAISLGRIGMAFTEEHRNNIALARLGTTATEETREKLSALKREQCNEPVWRKKMSEQTTAGWKDPDIRAAMIEGQQAHFDTTDNGSNFPIGTPQSQLNYARVLAPVGFIMNHIILTGRSGGHKYTLDLAHLILKINIEIDGSSHRFKQDHDARRDIFLRSIGWIVMRIPV